ncbi:MAG: FtsX-like permease family protein [Marmoricola sp.]
MLRAAWKSLLGRKLRLLMSTFAIVLGVAFVGGTLIFTDTLNKSFVAIFDNSVGDVVVRPVGAGDADTPTTLTMPAGLVNELADVPGAARADGNVATFGLFVIGKNNRVVGGQGAPGIGVNNNSAPAAHGVEGLQVVEGHAPHGADEVAIDAATVRRADIFIGEKVRLVSAGKKALLQPRLVGIADYPEGGSLNGATVSIFDTPTAQDLFLDGKAAFTDAWVTAKPGVSQKDLRARVAKVLPKGYEAVTGDKAAKDAAAPLLEAISFITIFLLVFAGIALVVGSFLIVNTFSMLVAQRSRELALFRALGASRKQVTRSVLFEAFVVGLVGSIIGLGLGVLLAIGIRALFGRIGLDLSGTSLVFGWRTPVAAFAVGLVVTMVAAYLPARRSSLIPPIAALRDDVAMPESSMRRRLLVGGLMMLAGVAAGAVGLFTHVPKQGYWVGAGALLAMLGMAAASPVTSQPFLALAAGIYRRLFGSIGVLAGQNSLRSPRRTAATASALMIGLTLVTTMSIAGASAKASIDRTVQRTFLGDIVISNAVGAGFSPQIATMASKEPGVQSVTRFRSAMAKLGGDRKFITGADPATLSKVLRLDLQAGSLADFTGNTMLVSKKVAKDNHYKVGQELTFRFPKGPTKLRIVGIHDAEFAGFLTTLDALKQGGFAAQDSSLLLKLDPGANSADVKAELEKATAKLPIITVKDQTEYAAEQRASIDPLILMIYALLGLALIIAVLGVVNTLGLSIIERTREIGLLRAIGVDRRQMRRMVSLESVAIAVLGALMGIGMGLVFGIALMASLRDEGLEVTRIPWQILGIYLLAAVVIGLLAARLPARRAARLDVLQAIGTE